MTNNIQYVESIIKIQEIQKKIKLLQVTDMHLTLADETNTQRTREIARQREKEFAHEDWENIDIFDQILSDADKWADILVLTGDIMDFPSGLNLAKLDSRLNKDKKKYFFVPGNHDWNHYYINERKGWEPEFMEVLKPFTDNADYSELKIDGVILIGIDNSRYQIGDYQFKRFKDTLSVGKPCILFMHIPIYIPSLESKTMERWGSPIVMGIPEHLFGYRPGTIPSPMPTQTTWEFCDAALNSPNLRGIFTGHLHFSHKGIIPSGGYQYVSPPGYKARACKITLQPDL